MQDFNLLLVEDQAETLLVLFSVISAWGYTVQTAKKGLEALRMIEISAPDMIISDWDMPVLNGPELFKIIRSTPSNHDIYLIFLTARNDTASWVEGLQTGADDFLHKPTGMGGFEELKARIEAGCRILDRRKALKNTQDH